MSKALLINPSYFRTYGSTEGGIAFPVYPVLSITAIAAAVRQRGHEVSILDLSYRRYEPDLVEEVIRREQPDLVGITATTPLANQMRDISYLVKDVSPEIITVAGGAHPTAMPEESMRESCLDHVAAGEADWTLPDLLDGVRPEDVGGLYRWEGGQVCSTPMADLHTDLDHLPMPAWELYPSEANEKMTKIIARHQPVTTVEFSRGCVYRCDFCGSKNTMGRGYRKKSPERCAEELVKAASLGFREVVLVDDIFTTNNEWAAAVCEEIIRKDPGVAWTCTNGIRVDSANDELFELMRRAGCYRVYFGFESGNEAVLEAFGKGGKASLSKGVDAVEMARNAGLEPNGFFLVGLTGDTEETMQDTIDYARKVRLDTMKCGLTVPFPGTPMFNALHAEGRIKTFDWDEYTVYNEAQAIFDHPTLSWDVITKYFHRFYLQAYVLNPAYLWRRLKFTLRNHELFWNVYYTMKFWRLLGKSKDPGEEEYRYADRWRPLDTPIDTPLPDRDPPKAKPGGRKHRRRSREPVETAVTLISNR